MKPLQARALIRPSGTFSHARAREKALNDYCLLPFEEWEKVADRPDEGSSMKLQMLE
jgi:hypothetical protein